MKQFSDEQGRAWVATAASEDTPRHHGRWYMVFEPAANTAQKIPVPEIRWQTAATAARTIRTMSDVELRRRLKSALVRYEEA